MTSIEALTPEQLAAPAAWLSVPETNQWLTSEWRGRTVDPSALAIALRNKRNRMFLVRHDGSPCGLVALAELDTADRCAMVWYILGDKSLSGRGIVSSAVGQLCSWAFRELRLSSVYAWIMRPNIASRRVLERNGFRECGHLRAAAQHEGQQVDRVYFDLIAGER